MKRVTMLDVLAGLKRCPGGYSFAGDIPITGSVQAISNALRHAGYREWVTREFPDAKRNRAVWFITKEGRAALTKREIP